MSASAAMTAGPNLSIRWAFDVSRWLPTSEEWILAMKCVKEESERARIRRFRYAQDAKASLVGALMLRRLATGPMQLSAASFRRNDRGRPCLTDARATQWDFNVSHQGSYTVLAAEGPSLYPVKGCSPVKSGEADLQQRHIGFAPCSDLKGLRSVMMSFPCRTTCPGGSRCHEML
jgi:hypothetical protein